ncbi:MAG: secretion system protein [Aeromicrobium sp.]|jgi:tight adherence protein C|nr:secretion system protein [Aeromicrobium sp.]
MLLLGAVLLLGACVSLLVSLDLVQLGLAGRESRRRRETSPRSTGIAVTNDLESLGRLRLLTISSLTLKAERNLALAGHRPGWTLRRMMLAKVWLAAGVGFVFLLMFGADHSGRMLVFGLLAVGFAFFVPDLLLDGRARERQERIEREIPDLLDQTLIAIESGMSFEGALARVGHSGSGPLAEELVRTLQDMRLGMSRRAAYHAMAERTSIEDLKRFCKQVVQAEEFGVSTSTLIRNLAKEMRLKRRFRAEEAAQKLPVKMVFPLVACFLPVVFVVNLYPAIHSLIEFF